MKRQDIVRMTNQIADFHRPYPREEAEAGVARHILDFWDPRMRADLAAQLAEDETGFTPLALAGAKRVVAQTRAPA
jgi:formate dehydrogenase subunit delta